MDHTPMEQRDVVIDINSSVDKITETGSPGVSYHEVGSFDSGMVCGMQKQTVDELANAVNSASLYSDLQCSVKKPKKIKCMSHGSKKPCKPPRPPRGLSLDAADTKLIREITEIAKLKRARIERMKALKEAKTAKAPSASMSPSGNWIAMLFTILFFVVIILQGCHPTRIKLENSATAAGISDSTLLNGAKGSYIEQLKFFSSNMQLPRSVSPGMKELLPSSANSIDRGETAS